MDAWHAACSNGIRRKSPAYLNMMPKLVTNPILVEQIVSIAAEQDGYSSGSLTPRTRYKGRSHRNRPGLFRKHHRRGIMSSASLRKGDTISRNIEFVKESGRRLPTGR